MVPKLLVETDDTLDFAVVVKTGRDNNLYFVTTSGLEPVPQNEISPEDVS